MCGSWPPLDHPFLTDANCIKTSEQDTIYNCIAWAAGEVHRWWWPDPFRISYWPRSAPRSETIDAFIAAYSTVGFSVCNNGALEDGIEKIALFAKSSRGLMIPTHAARQLTSGKWTSKMGPLEDVIHDLPDDPRGPIYGVVVCYMARQRR